MRAPWTDREHGGRDMRLLPAAAGMWTAALAAAPLMQPHNTRTLITVAAVLVCSVGGMALAAWMAHVTRNHAAFARRAATVLILALAGLLLGAMAAVTHTAMRAADPVYAASAQGAALGIYRVRTTAPALRANDREADCAVDVTVEQAVLDGVQQSAHASATLQASGRVCAMIEQGARYTVHGTAQRAAWDTARVILTAHTATMHEAAMPWWHGIETLRARFFAVTARLDDQGRVLVPGVTLGLLGQDILTGARVDETYARQLEERCKQAGIMHVMAVSGGHYALIARLCTIIGALARLPCGVLAMLRLATAGMLTMLLVPGQSVTRALSMSVFAVGYALCKRPCQTMHALCWTTMFALLTDPTRAANFGFALSCSAVCGIAMMMPRIQAWCARWMPRGAAQALAMTVSAQVFTLPVQILISPQVPLWSIPANLMVAPFTDLATITGLLSCLCATVCPPVAPCSPRSPHGAHVRSLWRPACSARRTMDASRGRRGPRVCCSCSARSPSALPCSSHCTTCTPSSSWSAAGAGAGDCTPCIQWTPHAGGGGRRPPCSWTYHGATARSEHACGLSNDTATLNIWQHTTHPAASSSAAATNTSTASPHGATPVNGLTPTRTAN
ncbi:ComEC/Rec2 family competence protein [Bifidobacterium pseudolongum]|uniref:ComEC/Rec2 family competence protein n=1 Tax=Bifidobacterium pseudolongum TaxID=1694 RepID=UPI0022E29F44|nr:ComEC/Rec2 family competence protein [Bifidobacterium pseudolongum]